MYRNGIILLGRNFSSRRTLPLVTMFSKAEGCSLCDDAKEVMMKFKKKFIYEEVDITANGNQEWFNKYKYDIPVIHINNQEVMRHKVFEKPFLEALKQAESRSS